MLGTPSRLGIDRGWFRGFSYQEAPQADGEEEAPQAVAQDARSAQKQEVTAGRAGLYGSSDLLPDLVGDAVVQR
jgi:hypothetical protein